MPTTLHTRLTQVLQEVNFLRQVLSEKVVVYATYPQSANEIVGLTQRLNASITGILLPAIAHQGLPEYAAAQFGDPDFHLELKMAGAKLLLEDIIGQAQELIPVDGNGYVLKDIWHADGSVSVLQIQPNQTAALCTALQAFVDAIPAE